MFSKYKSFLPIKNNRISIFLLLVFYFQSSFHCSEKITETSPQKLQQKIENKEIKAITLTDSLQVEEIKIGCMDFKNFPTEVIIQTKEEYNNFLNKKVSLPNCSSYQLPGIDFSKSTLLGYKTTTSGCQPPEYTRTISCDNTTGACTYSISIKENGLCKKGWPSMNWIAVQKIPDGYKISYVLN